MMCSLFYFISNSLLCTNSADAKAEKTSSAKAAKPTESAKATKEPKAKKTSPPKTAKATKAFSTSSKATKASPTPSAKATKAADAKADKASSAKGEKYFSLYYIVVVESFHFLDSNTNLLFASLSNHLQHLKPSQAPRVARLEACLML